MEKAIQIPYDERFGESCRYAAAAGFTAIAVDYCPVGSGRSDAIWDAVTENILASLERHRLTCVQTHPYFYDCLMSAEERGGEIERDMRKAIESSAKIGAKFCVFHPLAAVTAGYSHELGLEINKEWLGSLLEHALACGTGVAAENLPLFWKNGAPKPPVRSNYDLLAPLADYFNDPHMGICWDFGHANQTSREEHADLITALGSRIVCTHVHNNYGVVDYHQPPIYGNIAWDTVLPALKATGYNGPMTLEVAFPQDKDCLMRSTFIAHNYACLSSVMRCIE